VPAWTGPVQNTTSLALGDVDRDGDLDLVTGGTAGLGYFENTGNAATARFVQRSGGENPLDGLATGAIHAPRFVDLDGDGDLDLVSANGSGGAFFVLENTGSATSPAFALLTGAANPLDGIVTDPVAKPAFGDLDGDGDSDFAFSGNGNFTYLANTGDATSPAFLEQTGAGNPLTALPFGIVSSLAPGDLDADGDLDLLAGELSGTFPYFENTGSATNPAYLWLPSEQNPMDGFEVTLRSVPAFGDLDADGDLDVIGGDADGVLHVYYMPEPAQGALLGAGFALLAWLRRRR
jgi:hypothetical protein